MSRLWIVCATCGSSWPIQGSRTPYMELQTESQPCPSCEAYTLSCLAAREGSVGHPHHSRLSEIRFGDPLAEV